MRKQPINIVNLEYSMLIGFYFFVLRCWRFPRRGFAPPRNDILGGAVQQHDKLKFKEVYNFSAGGCLVIFVVLADLAQDLSVSLYISS